MSLLTVCLRRPGPGASPEPDGPAQRALAAAQAQGFAAPQRLTWPGGEVWVHPTPGQASSTATHVAIADGRFAVLLGTAHQHGVAGEALLHRLLQASVPPTWDEISGAFALVVVSPEGAWLATDALGLMKVWATGDGTVLSTSYLVCCAAANGLTPHRLPAAEFALFGAVHGHDSPFAEVRLLDPAARHLLVPGRSAEGCHDPRRLCTPPAGLPASFDAAVACLGDAYLQEFSGLLRAHEGQVGMALSGGFDSRLLLALLDRLGVRPDLFVYGRPEDDDVVMARQVADRLGHPIDAIDKRVQARALPGLDATRLRENLLFMDGTSVDGVFDTGVDRLTRLQQVAQGRLNLNGGGGEILRNFFYLPDRPFSAVEVAATFYGSWLPQVFLDRADRTRFAEDLPDRLLQALGRPHGDAAARHAPLPRAEVELLYSLFRLRYWMGRNNSLAARMGAFMTPLVTPRLVHLCAHLPMAWKAHGRLEAALIRWLSPRVASGPSSYGFSFAEGPSVRHRLAAQFTLWRSPAMRQRSVQLKRALGRVPTPTAPAEWVAALGETPALDGLDLGQLTEPAQLNRAMSLQALVAWQRTISGAG